MRIPLQVTFLDMPVSDDVEAACWREAEDLDRLVDRITSCRIIVTVVEDDAAPARRYQVRLDLRMPGREIVVNRGADSHQSDDVFAAVRNAFQTVRDELQLSIVNRLSTS